MATALAARQFFDPTVAGVCAVCVEVLSVTGATIVLIVGGDIPAMSYVSDTRYEDLEATQFALGVGPGLDAFRQGLPVSEPDLDAWPPQGWGGFAPAAVIAGVLAVSAFPLRIGAVRLGALTLYQDHVGSLGPDTYADALVMSEIVTRLILTIQSGAVDDVLAVELEEGAVDYAEVHQASGMVAVQLDVGVGEALAVLRARAFVDGTPVRLLALEVTGRRLRFDP